MPHTIINPEEAVALRDLGWSVSAIARHFGCGRKSVVRSLARHRNEIPRFLIPR